MRHLVWLVFLYAFTLSAQADFRGRVIAEVYWVPKQIFENFTDDRPVDSLLQDYRKPGEITYHICGDTLYSVNSTAPDLPPLHRYQYGHVSLLPDTTGTVFTEFRKLRSFNEDIRAEHWTKYRRRPARNPLGFNYRLINPHQRQRTTWAQVAQRKTHSRQFEAGGQFKAFLHPFGKEIFAFTDFDTIYIGEKFTYYPDEKYDCEQFFQGVEITRRVTEEIPRHTVYYDPDTVIDLDATHGIFTVGEVYDSLGRLNPIISPAPAEFKLIEVWTECKSCYVQQPYLAALRDKYKPEELSILSLYADYGDDPGAFISALATRPKTSWPQYMVPNGRSSFFGREYNLRLLPRYILLDEEDRIIMKYAPRPNDNRLNTVLEQLLGH